ncbi:MAG: Flp pilus assembly complex ATPase component TadA [Victivallales bacterium]|jgi:type II secretory ATPase GspE/PulE/Tfp pilus assembly ATPase PilB-like protein|nr:Flp pilus assembly complex ATPase component TadA [Victivallales bacterium]
MIYYNWISILILAVWVFTGVCTLDFIAAHSRKEDAKTKWLNLAALLFGPVTLLFFYIFLQAPKGNSPANYKKIERSLGAIDSSFALLNFDEKPVVPIDGKVESAESTARACAVLEKAFERKATRVTITPDDEGEYEVFLRINAIDKSSEHLDCLRGGSLVSALKHAAGMEIRERSSSQIGKIFVKMSGLKLSCFVKTSRVAAGEKIEIRLGNNPHFPPLETLGLPAEALARLHEICANKSGLILLLAPPGGGRTTTFYAILQSKEMQDCKVATFESPIELDLENATQNELDPFAGKTLLKLVGDAINTGVDALAIGVTLNDSESARLAVNFACKGHLVIALLNCITPAEAFSKFEHWEIPPRTFDSTPLLLLSQTLFRQSDNKLAAVFALPDRTALDNALKIPHPTFEMVRRTLGEKSDLLPELESQLQAQAISQSEFDRVVKLISAKGK